MDMLKALSDITTAGGVSGNEREVGDVVFGYFKRYTDDVWRDTMGNTLCRIGSGKPVILFCAHMDEIGMMVNTIEDNGMLKICSVAGVDPRVLPGSKVVVYGKEKLTAVVGAVPPHLQSGARKAYKIDDLPVDTGYPVEKVRELVQVGDFVTFDQQPPMELKNGYVTGKTFDDRSLVVALIEMLDILSKVKLNCTCVFCATTQEERGSHGAKGATYNIRPDFAVATDVCHAPMPGTSPNEVTDPSKVSLTTGGNIHPGVFTMLKASADEQNIAYAVDACMGPTGTDAWGVQPIAGGVPCGLVSLPLRYMHTSVETISMDTLKNCAKVMAGIVINLGEDWEDKLCWKD